MEDILIELVARAPIAAVAIYAIWRISIVMEVLAKTIETIAISQNQSISDIVDAELRENGKVAEFTPILPN